MPNENQSELRKLPAVEKVLSDSRTGAGHRALLPSHRHGGGALRRRQAAG